MFITFCFPLSYLFASFITYMLFLYTYLWQFKNMFIISLICFPSKCRGLFLLPCVWALLSELLLTNWTWQKWWCMTPDTRSKRPHSPSLIFLMNCCSREHSCRVVRPFNQPYGQSYGKKFRTPCQQLARSEAPCQQLCGEPWEAEPRVSGEHTGDWSLRLHVECNLVRPLSQNHHLSCFQVPDPPNLWANKCLLF